MPSLLVTNDFPPKVGGIQSYLYELWRRLPAGGDDRAHDAVRRAHRTWDAAQAFRSSARARGGCCRHRRLARRVDALAREVDADVVFLDPMVPLGLIGRAARRGALRRRRARRRGHGARARSPGCGSCPASVLRGAAGIVAAGEYPAARGGARRRPRAADARRAARCRPGAVPARRRRRAPAPTRRASASTPTAPLVLGVSRLVPRKGFDVLLDAVAGLPACRSRSPAPGATARRLDRRAARARRPRAHLLGRVADAELPALYASADVFAMLCRDRWGGLEAEGFGIVFVEAAACGVPSVAGRSGGSHEAVVDGRDRRRGRPAQRRASRPWRIWTRCWPTTRVRDRLGTAARARAVGELSYDALAARLAPLAAGDLGVLAAPS